MTEWFTDGEWYSSRNCHPIKKGWYKTRIVLYQPKYHFIEFTFQFNIQKISWGHIHKYSNKHVITSKEIRRQVWPYQINLLKKKISEDEKVNRLYRSYMCEQDWWSFLFDYSSEHDKWRFITDNEKMAFL